MFNTGSATAPAFAAAGAADPLAGMDAGDILLPKFVDLDGDGIRDMAASVDGHQLRYFRNTGSEAHPAFVAQTGSANPFAGLTELGSYPAADFADLDGDGDLDGLSGTGRELGFLRYLRNSGSPAAPSFLHGSSSEVFGSSVGWMYTRTSPELGDIDGDGDLDLVIGLTNHTMKYFENTGSTSAPRLVERSGGDNPLISVGIPHET